MSPFIYFILYIVLLVLFIELDVKRTSVKISMLVWWATTVLYFIITLCSFNIISSVVAFLLAIASGVPIPWFILDFAGKDLSVPLYLIGAGYIGVSASAVGIWAVKNRKSKYWSWIFIILSLAGCVVTFFNIINLHCSTGSSVCGDEKLIYLQNAAMSILLVITAFNIYRVMAKYNKTI